MTYATLQDLTDLCGLRELIQLTDRAEPPADLVDEAVAGKALADADAEIDGYLAARYQLPLTPPPALIGALAADIARYRLSRAPTDAVRTRYEDAVKTLGNIARGVIRLDVAGVEAPAIPGGSVQLIGGERLFSRDALRGL